MATVATGTATGSDDEPDQPQPLPSRQAYRTGLAIIGIALVMGTGFALSYTLALGRPLPRDVPVASVGPSAGGTSPAGALRGAATGGLDLVPYPSLPAARAAVAEQRVYAVVVDQPPTLYVSSASGSSVARALEQLAQALPPSTGVRVVDLHPLPRSDPQGLTAFYVTIAATILGFVPVFQLRANAPGTGLRDWIVLLAVLALSAGLVLALVSDTVLGALDGAFAEIWLLICAQTAIAALFNSLMLVVVGRWAILPTWAVFIVLGNSSSGGAVAAPLLPAFFAMAGRVLPTGATVSALHTAVYFRGHQHATPFLVLGSWLAGLAVLLVVAARVRGRSPAQ
jgi:hypothetical protein